MRQNLKNARKALDLTQIEIAHILKMTENQYQRLESDKSDGRVKTWKQLKKITGMTIDLLIESTADES